MCECGKTDYCSFKYLIILVQLLGVLHRPGCGVSSENILYGSPFLIRKNMRVSVLVDTAMTGKQMPPGLVQ